jgi:TPR repeat protein
MRRFFFAICLVVAGANVAAAGPPADADSAYQRGDYAKAAQLFRPLAEQGDTKAQFSLGWMYFTGQIVPQDVREAMRWYRKAAEQGLAKA